MKEYILSKTKEVLRVLPLFRFLIYKIKVSIQEYVSQISKQFNNSLSAFNSIVVKVTPSPIFRWSGAHSLKSYLASLPFQLIKFNSFPPFLVIQQIILILFLF